MDPTPQKQVGRVRRRALVWYPNSGEEWDADAADWKKGTGCTQPQEFAQQMIGGSKRPPDVEGIVFLFFSTTYGLGWMLPHQSHRSRRDSQTIRMQDFLCVLYIYVYVNGSSPGAYRCLL